MVLHIVDFAFMQNLQNSVLSASLNINKHHYSKFVFY